MEKCCKDRQAKNDHIIKHMHLACWLTKATDTKSEYVNMLLFHGNNGYAKAPQCHVTCTLPVLLRFEWVQLAVLIFNTITNNE
jgi:hypothetical protein